MKTINIIAISATVIFIAVIVYYIDQAETARLLDWGFTDWGGADFDYNAWEANRRAPGVTFEAGLVMALFILFYIYVNISNMVKVKTISTKVLSIIGISFTGIIFLWDLAMLSSPASISFGEASGAFGVFALIMLAFTIVFLVQSIKDPDDKIDDPDVIDDIV